MSDLPRYGNAGVAAYPSGIIWADCPANGDPADIYHFHDEFINSTIVVDTSISNWDIGGTNDDIDWLGSVGTGIVDLATSGADNDSAFMKNQPFTTFSLGSGKKIWMECRVAFPTITDWGFAFGLGESAFWTAEAVADDCADLITESFVGFRVVVGDPDGMDFVYQLDAGAEVEDITGPVQTLVAATYYRLGFKFNGQNAITVYVDGAKVGSFTITSATFPDGVNMAAGITLKAGAAAAYNAYIDWIRIAAMR